MRGKTILFLLIQLFIFTASIQSAATIFFSSIVCKKRKKKLICICYDASNEIDRDKYMKMFLCLHSQQMPDN